MDKENLSRPELLVQFESGWRAGNCYSKQRYIVKRARRPIDKEFIYALDNLGAFGWGQELDWNLLPDETITVHPKWSPVTYSVAEVIRGCDSSD